MNTLTKTQYWRIITLPGERCIHKSQHVERGRALPVGRNAFAVSPRTWARRVTCLQATPMADKGKRMPTAPPQGSAVLRHSQQRARRNGIAWRSDTILLYHTLRICARFREELALCYNQFVGEPCTIA